MLQLDLQSRLPLYEQIIKQISQLILDEELVADDQLPSVRQVARSAGINPNTVQKAYQSLEQGGLIYSVPGRGSFVSASPKGVEMLVEQTKHQLKKAIQVACRAGIPKEIALEIVQEVYEEVRDDYTTTCQQEL